MKIPSVEREKEKRAGLTSGEEVTVKKTKRHSVQMVAKVSINDHDGILMGTPK